MPRAAGKPGARGGGAPAPRRAGQAPRLVVFDLDDTVWYPEMYMLRGAPFRRVSASEVEDRAGESITVYEGARRAIAQIVAGADGWGETLVAYASRTEHGDWAEECLLLLSVPGPGGGKGKVTLYDAAAHMEIYGGSKVQHFQALQRKTGLAYDEMLFFDNERWNITEVGRLGVRCVYTPGGMTEQHWAEGVRMFV